MILDEYIIITIIKEFCIIPFIIINIIDLLQSQAALLEFSVQKNETSTPLTFSAYAGVEFNIVLPGKSPPRA